MDALQLEGEEEGASYLADLNKVPDFVDEPPVELEQVSAWCLSSALGLGLTRPQPATKEAVKTTG